MKPTTITLPGERAEQLRTLAASEGITISETVERFINAAIEAGRLKDELPGFHVAVAQGHVWVSLDTFSFPPIHPNQAHEIADRLDWVTVEGMNAYGKWFYIGRQDSHVILKIQRRGRGVIISGAAGERTVKKSVTSVMARDLARIIRNAADEAQNL